MIISIFFSVTYIIIFVKFTLSPSNVHHIHSNHLCGSRSNSKWWSTSPSPYVYSGIDQRWWHSIWCLLHTGGGHCRDLHLIRATHSKGVLQYSAVESAMLFHSTDDMLVIAHMVIKAMTLCKESIKHRMSPPSVAHVTAYMSVIDGDPSGAQHPTVLCHIYQLHNRYIVAPWISHCADAW